MSNTPCAYAVDSVLHRRVEIKVVSGHCGGELPPRFYGGKDLAVRILDCYQIHYQFFVARTPLLPLMHIGKALRGFFIS